MYVDTIRVKDIERYTLRANTIIIDLRSKEEYEKSHIPNASNIPYEDIDDYMLSIDQYDNVLLYCERGNLSLLAARELCRKCRGHMASVGGGYLAYQQFRKLFERSGY